ncbi:DUF1801 domain-containing protein [Demequina litorisediminis]|uniref:DUF1801 domain-containing protein n=1 Tax=Demequina litorisediminis TaxID=1849022 RepID=UPI003D6661CE
MGRGHRPRRGAVLPHLQSQHASAHLRPRASLCGALGAGGRHPCVSGTDRGPCRGASSHPGALQGSESHPLVVARSRTGEYVRNMRDADVDLWMGHYTSPMKDVVQHLRWILLASDDRVEESIKWSTPTFSYRGDIASFYPQGSMAAVLVFHRAGLLPTTFPGLEPAPRDGRVMRIISIAEAEDRRDTIEDIVHAWIDWRDGAGSSVRLEMADAGVTPRG